MGHRSTDLQDGTLQDIMHICSSMEQLLLSYPSGEMPYIYAVNFLELLFQSARTRICILREPPVYDRSVCSAEKMDGIVVFSTFRKQKIYQTFLEQLSKRLLKHKKYFLEHDCECLPGTGGCFYICLARVYPENDGVVLGRNHSREAYHRLETLLRILVEGGKSWGLDIQAALYDCLQQIPAGWNGARKQEADIGELPNVPDVDGQNGVEQWLLYEDYLKPLYEWVEWIYEQTRETPLVRVAQPGDSQAVMDFSNLFFFLKVNARRQEGNAHDCDDFNIRMICPPRQRLELSRFYHRHREDQCQWHGRGGSCRISGMGECLFTPYWQTAPASGEVIEDEMLEKHYAGIWDVLEKVAHADHSGAEMAFRSSSILFDRRQRRLQDGSGEGRVNGDCKRDRLAACVTYRMLSPVDENGNREDQVPQIMFVPVYAGAAPFMLAATVVNAQLPEPLGGTLSEWRRSYRFAGMVFQFLSSRLKETARKAYLNKATDLVQDLYDVCEISSAVLRDRYKGADDCFLEFISAELDDLSKYYPYDQIILEKQQEVVINREIQSGIFTTPKGCRVQVRLKPNPYWHSFSGKSFFSAADVAREFLSGMARIAAAAGREQIEWTTFCMWHLDMYGHFPPNRNQWRVYARKKGWDGSEGKAGSLDPHAGSSGEDAF